MTVVTGIFAFIFILGAAVVLHEFGHFLVAKLFRIRVETFSVGFGPRIFGRKWGQTDYRVSAIPLGGYVKLGGDESNAPIEGAGSMDRDAIAFLFLIAVLIIRPQGLAGVKTI